jgi:cholest-4-en-3-one 26-monooxygenase
MEPLRGELDVYDPGAYVEEVPHAAFRWLRRNDPVHWQALPGGGGYWALTRHADVVAASRDPETFSAAQQSILIQDPDPEALPMLRTQLLSMDPPEHGRLRRTVLGGFTPGMVRRMEPRIRELAAGILDAAADRGECDFVREVAAELPVQVIAEIMGVPASDRHRLSEWGDRLTGMDDPETAVSPQETRQASFDMGAYGFALAGERKGRAGGDLISVLMNAEFEGHRVTEVEFAGLFVQITVAGNETTRTLLSQALLALIEHPDAWRALRAAPVLLETAVEELLRFTSPLHYFRRTATRDVELRGRKIREGEAVALLYSSANRDEEVFALPDRLDLRREPNPHLAFGFGEHFCLGAKLARLEARVFFEELLARFERIELAGPPRRLRSNLINGLKALPVRLVRRAGAEP